MTTSAKARSQPAIVFALAAAGLIATICAVSQPPAGIHLHFQLGEAGISGDHVSAATWSPNDPLVPRHTRTQWGRARRQRLETLKFRSVFAERAQLFPP